MSDWIRVTRHDRCPICQHDTWCTYNEDVVICMRNNGGTEKVFKDGSVGYVHRLSGGTKTTAMGAPHREKTQKATINAKKLMEEFCAQQKDGLVMSMARELGVSAKSLWSLGCAWADSYRAFAFPMKDGYGNIVGIRLRSVDGRKWAVTGSRQGIFFPPHSGQRRAFVLEGPTDTAAAITLGFYGVGRPSCSGGMEPIRVLFRRLKISEAVIVADNDDPGINGAAMIQKHLPIPTAILTLPTKDLRIFLKNGGNKEDVDEMIGSLGFCLNN